MPRSCVFGILFIFSCFALSRGNSNTTASVNVTTEPLPTTTPTTSLTTGVMSITFVPSTTEMNNSTTAVTTVPTLASNASETTSNSLNTTGSGISPPTFAPILLNVTSIIQMLNYSNATFDVLALYNLTWDLFFVNVLNFTRQEELELKETFVNTSEGDLLLEIIQTNFTFVLGGYDSELGTEAEYVYFYALLLDFYNNLDNDSFVQEFMETVVLGYVNATYRLNSQRLTSRSCEIHNNAGGSSDFCESMTTSTPIQTTTSVPVALIAGCAVAGSVLLILIVVVIICICKKLSKSKVTPKEEFEAHSSESMSRPHSFCTGSVGSVRSH